MISEEGAQHLLLVVDVAVEDRVHARRQVLQLHVHAPLADAQLERRQVVAELGRGRGLRDERRVVEGEVGELLAGVDGHVGGALGERDHARLGDVEQEEHLHHLDLGEGLAAAQVRAVLDQVARELARVRRRQHRRVLLLLEHHTLPSSVMRMRSPGSWS